MIAHATRLLPAVTTDPAFPRAGAWLVDELAGVGAHETTALGEGKYRVQNSEVVEDRLRRQSLAALEGDERLDLLTRDPVERASAEKRPQVDAQAGVVVLERRALTAELGEVRDHALAALGGRNSPRLPPRLGEPFGGSTGLVDVGAGRQLHEEAIGRPADDPSLPLVDLTIDADQTTLLVDHRKHDPVVEDDELFAFHAKLGEGAEPVVQEGTNCRPAFANLHPPVKDRIGSEEAHHCVDVTLIHSLESTARQRNRAGRRGLLRHDPVSIAQDD
jgi:hypothetical protein